MKYQNGHEVTCGVFDLPHCGYRNILGKKFKFLFETVLKSNCLLIGKLSKFDYC